MRATIKVLNFGNSSTLIIKYGMASKIVHYPTTEIKVKVQKWTEFLQGHGYNVTVKEEK